MPTDKTIYLIANGDLRLSANQACQEAQANLEKGLIAAIRKEGYSVIRGHPYDPVKRHGFIDSQKYGMKVFRNIPADAPLIVAEAVWQYTSHILAGLSTHRGPILTVANWSGTWPGLVGMLNLNGSLTKAGVAYSTLWSEDFTDKFFLAGLRSWLKSGKVRHDTSHVRALKNVKVPAAAAKVGRAFAQKLKRDKLIMGVFDEGCMGMFNAIIPDELLHPTGIFKERLSQSALYAKMSTVKDDEARAVYDWLLRQGMKFRLGPNEETDLTEAQVLGQCRMYIAAVRIAAEFGCETIGIQYQQGLKDLTPASDLVEGLLNNRKRPPVYDELTGDELFKGEALPHFNEVDECAGLDGVITYKLWRELGYPAENTLHDIRWARQFSDKALDAYVWVFLISGAAPAEHFGGYKNASSERQPAMYFRLGGGSLKGVSKPGWIVWSRVYIDRNKLKFDTGLAEAVKLPQAETDERHRLTTPQWPIMHAVLQGISRDQMMARHQSNHIQVVYAPDKAAAKNGLLVKAAAMAELGLDVSICGKV
jgi:L-fucose isomerase-like protein